MPDLQQLSPRQTAVARLMLRGMRPAEIAAAMDLNVQTVKNHMIVIYREAGIDGDMNGKLRRFIEKYIGTPLPARSAGLHSVPAVKLRCASEDELRDWRGDRPAARSVRLFCLDARHDWCVEQRQAGRCIRDEVDYQSIARQRQARAA